MSTTRPRGFIPNYAPRPDTLALINATIGELNTYVPIYGPMTVRQIFYRLVSTVAFPKQEKDYKRLCEILQKARRGRLIGFDQIRDDGDTIELPDGYRSLEHFVSNVRYWGANYELRKDIGQPIRQLVMIEAAGMVPQIVRTAAPFGAEVRSAGGFNGVTGKYELAKNIVRVAVDEDRSTRVLHIGDFDPSGEHVFSSLEEDITAFVRDIYGTTEIVDFERIAVLEPHIAVYGLPTAPPKPTDDRSFSGTATVQAEALTPAQMAALLEQALLQGWDQSIADKLVDQQADHRERIADWLSTDI
jgi:hypothetical protein